MSDEEDIPKTRVMEDLPKTRIAEEKPQKEGFLNSFFGFENLRSLAILIVVIFAFRWSVVSPYHVPTASMEPTIKVGDRLLAFKLAYNLKVPFTDFVVAEWGEPERGDIIVFKYPKNPDIDYVKRVVGIGGDRLKIRDDILFVNGTRQARVNHEFDRSILTDIDDYAETKILYKEKLDGHEHWVMQNKPAQRHFTSSNWPAHGKEFVVPPGKVFVIGDNRDNSTDSRVWGVVPMEFIRGQALFVIWSVFTPRDSNWPSIRFRRFGHSLN